MAIFDQKAELNKQKKKVAPNWDTSFLNKALGFKEDGTRSIYGRMIAKNMVLGADTLTHAVAKKTSNGSTQDVLNETFENTVNSDMSKLGFAVNIATKIAGGGLSGIGSVATGGANAAASQGAEAAGFLGGAGADNLGATDVSTGGGGKMKDMFSNFFNKGDGVYNQNSGMPTEEGNLNELNGMFNNVKNESQLAALKNPYPIESIEYEKFENMKKKMSSSITSKKINLGKEGKDLLSNSFGSITESVANFVGSQITQFQGEKNAVKNANQGSFADNSEFNYLF